MKRQKNQNGDDRKEVLAPPERLSDYPDGNLDGKEDLTKSAFNDEVDLPESSGKTISEATDPSKLSDL